MAGVVEAFKQTIEPEPNTRSQTRMVGTKQLNDLLDYVEKLERDRDKEIERLRRVERAAKNMIKWWEDSGLIYNCGPVEEIRAALEEK